MMELIKSHPSRSCWESHWMDSLCAVLSDRCATWLVWTRDWFLFYRIWSSLLREVWCAGTHCSERSCPVTLNWYGQVMVDTLVP